MWLAEAGTVVAELVGWYRAEARELPWRTEPSAYRVLLSEVMAQQTQIETMLPYFERFLGRWPTLEDLAAASEQEVIAAWAGLGYYRRARYLHRAARRAVELGGLPTTAAGLRELPGIGPYTAGAIASIAHGERTAVVDGNVERVLSRLDGVALDPRSGPGRAALWARATELHRASPDGVSAGELNQGLMELGALVCTRAPACARCPLRERCVAHRTGRTAELPVRAPRRPPRDIRGVAVVIEVPGGELLGRRAPGGLLGGLWEPLRVALEGGDPPEPAAAALVGAVARGVASLGPRGAVHHVFTHRRLACEVFAARAEAWGGAVPEGYDELQVCPVGADPGMSTLARKIVALARAGDVGRPGSPGYPV